MKVKDLIKLLEKYDEDYEVDVITQLRKKRLISNRTYQRWIFLISNKL